MSKFGAPSWFLAACTACVGRQGAHTLPFQMQLHMNDPDVGLKAGQVTVLLKTGQFNLSQELVLELFAINESV